MAGVARNASGRPWLLYAYPWMPYPRRVTIYLCEKRIPKSLVQLVHVSDPQNGNTVVASQANFYPPRPEGSLPILAVPSEHSSEPTYIRQSMAIIEYLEEATGPQGPLASPEIRELRKGTSALARARNRELLGLAEELTVSWNPIRTFGSGAGTMAYPAGAKEMFRWLQRTLDTINRLLSEISSDYSDLSDDSKPVSIADIVLFQFLEFVDDCYGVDVTQGSGTEKTDVYGRTKQESYPVLMQWYRAFKRRPSAARDGDGETASPEVLARMQTWHPESLY